ncbi:hypothetical protein A4H97_28255 [Niastella yeongjuensis]|uniref:Uncharacterized protein n=1 Tax=Niastella yeongjuensis TaxID=354355 RepID=A0A1V9EVA1_9BACT|nr:Imm49 family immunity protein [Niastella yeongjuensis]OQP49785.1 hypothetical protein A4H97_28255 [Niastella yeongjuensis]SEP40341.1 Immunity protein 49 [Niastella yeongjuensis]
MATIEFLDQLLSDNKAREAKKLALIMDPAKKPFHILSFIGINEVYFIYKAFVEGDFKAARQHLYNMGMTNAWYYEKINGEIFDVLATFTYPLLSDSSFLIERYLTYTRMDSPGSFAACFGKAIQNVLKNDIDGLSLNIEGLKKRSGQGWEKNYNGVIPVFEGFIDNDKAKIEEGLMSLLAKHNKQNQPPVLKDFMNLEATALAKLAWRKGISVDVKSHLIPIVLLPVQEPDQYSGYEFFNEVS